MSIYHLGRPREEASPCPLLKRILKGHIEKVAVIGCSGFLDEIACEEVAVAGVTEEMTIEVVRHIKIGLRTNIPVTSRVPRPYDPSRFVVECIAVDSRQKKYCWRESTSPRRDLR